MAKEISLGESKSVSNFLFNIHTDTKTEEREILIGFLQRLQYNHFECKDQERPDFSINIEGLNIGVEITKYYSDFTRKGSRMQRKFMSWKQFAIKLKQTIAEKHDQFSNIYASIHFKENESDFNQLLNGSDLNEIIKSLKIYKNSKYTQATLTLNSEDFPHLSKYINQIYFEFKTDNDDFLWWNATLQSGEVKTVENSLNNIISKKENASTGYELEYDQKWLLIYASGMGLADIFPEFTNNFKRQGSMILVELDSKETELTPKKYDVENSKYFTYIFVWDKFHEKVFLISPYFKKIVDCGSEKIWINHLPVKNEKKR